MATKKNVKRPAVGQTLGANLEALAGRPLGPTLAALVELNPRNDWMRGLHSRSSSTTSLRRRLETDHGVVVLGELAHGYFGPHRDRLGATLDAGVMVYCDKQGLPPEVIGRDLAECLSIWAYVPDFFELRGMDAEKLDELHAELVADADPEGEGELLADREAILRLPGVRRLRSGAEVRNALDACLSIARELWPDEPRRPVMAATPEGSGQRLDVTRQRIRAIEAKALMKLAKMTVGPKAALADVAAQMDISVEEVQELLAVADGSAP
jgi:hypothetical protein